MLQRVGIVGIFGFEFDIILTLKHTSEYGELFGFHRVLPSYTAS